MTAVFHDLGRQSTTTKKHSQRKPKKNRAQTHTERKTENHQRHSSTERENDNRLRRDLRFEDVCIIVN